MLLNNPHKLNTEEYFKREREIKMTIRVLNKNILGNFSYTHWGNNIEDNPPDSFFEIFLAKEISCKWENRKQKAYILKTGGMDKEENFYPFPLKIGYILISSFLIIEAPNYLGKKPHFLNLIIYNKDYSQHRTLHLHFTTKSGLWQMQRIINYLNLYIDSDHLLNNIQESVLNHEKFGIWSGCIHDLMKIINNLDFNFWEEGRYVYGQGKDNIFLDNYEITNLPDCEYYQKLIKENIAFDSNRHYAYSPIPTSITKYKNESWSENLKENLIIACIHEYNDKEYIFSQIEYGEKNNWGTPNIITNYGWD